MQSDGYKRDSRGSKMWGMFKSKSAKTKEGWWIKLQSMQGPARINAWKMKTERKVLLCAALRGKRWGEMRRMYFVTQQSLCSTLAWKFGEILLSPREKRSKRIQLGFSRDISAVKRCFTEWRMSDSQCCGRVGLVWWAAWTPANTTHQN